MTDSRAEASELSGVAPEELLKMGQVAELSGVPVATIRHYLREGLLPDPVKTSRNMAYYMPEFVERIRTIRQLQGERYMPLRVIRDVLGEEADPERVSAALELSERMLERASAGQDERTPIADVSERFAIPIEALERMQEVGVLTPDAAGYSPTDVRIVEAIARFRAGGYDESLGFTVYDTLRYRAALEALVAEEVRVLMERLPGRVGTERAVELIESGVEPLNDLIGALHAKQLVAAVAALRD